MQTQFDFFKKEHFLRTSGSLAELAGPRLSIEKISTSSDCFILSEVFSVFLCFLFWLMTAGDVQITWFWKFPSSSLLSLSRVLPTSWFRERLLWTRCWFLLILITESPIWAVLACFLLFQCCLRSGKSVSIVRYCVLVSVVRCFLGCFGDCGLWFLRGVHSAQPSLMLSAFFLVTSSVWASFLFMRHRSALSPQKIYFFHSYLSSFHEVTGCLPRWGFQTIQQHLRVFVYKTIRAVGLRVLCYLFE